MLQLREMTQSADKKTYDVIIVGSGASGGMAAKVLTEHGLEVLVLEAGPPVDPQRDFKSHTPVWEMAYRGARPPDMRLTQWNQTVANEYNRHFFVKDTEHPYTTAPGKPFVWIRSRIVGGKTLHWGRLSWRLSDYDFKARSHDGYGDDWPISLSDLSPYYDRVEKFIGVSGSRDGLSQIPDGEFLPAMPPTCQEVIFRKAAASLGLAGIPMRVAMLTQDLPGQPHRQPCHYCGNCSYGCKVGAMFSSVASTLPAAEATKRLTLRPNSIVREVLVDPETGKARGVSVIDRETRLDYEFFAKAIVLGASALESTRILLNSRSSRYPNGLANSSDVLGRYLMDHFGGVGITGFLPMFKGTEVTNTDGKSSGTYIPRFRNLSEKHADFIRGYGFECWTVGPQSFPWYASSLPGFGEEFKRSVKHHYPALVSFVTRAEMLARRQNRVTIDPEVKDHWGIPVLRFDVSHSDNERAMARDALEKSYEIMEAANADILSAESELTAPGVIIHEMGTCRMGNDPRQSVLNSFNQAHDVKNLFVIDAGCFVSSGCQNPTLTILALSWRACDYLAEEFRLGNI